MTVGAADIWSLVLDRSEVDPDDLAAALDGVARVPAPDFRTQLLIRDSIHALERHRGSAWVKNWLDGPSRRTLEDIWRSDLGEAGFPTLEKRIMDKTRPDNVERFLRELGNALTPEHADHCRRIGRSDHAGPACGPHRRRGRSAAGHSIPE